MLAALIILGLAMGGMTQAVRVIGRAQAGAARLDGKTRALRRAEQDLSNLMARRGPFVTVTTDAFSGDAAEFDFACGGSSSCRGQAVSTSQGRRLIVDNGAEGRRSVPLPGAGQVNLVYGGERDPTDAWPPGGARQTLRWIGLLESSGDQATPLATTPVWREEAPGCVFDPIIQTCRTAAP
jgi:hypothetical protein